MGKLSDWATEQSPFIKLQDGESVEGVYKGFKFVDDPFNPDKQRVRYLIEVNGAVKHWETSSGIVAKRFDEINKETRVKITRFGEAFNTKYQVEVIE